MYSTVLNHRATNTEFKLVGLVILSTGGTIVNQRARSAGPPASRVLDLARAGFLTQWTVHGDADGGADAR